MLGPLCPELGSSIECGEVLLSHHFRVWFAFPTLSRSTAGLLIALLTSVA